MKKLIIMALLVASTIGLSAQVVNSDNELPKSFKVETEDGKKVKLKRIYNEIVVNATKEEVWEALANFQDIAEFHGGLVSSKGLTEHAEGVDCERFCSLEFGGKKIEIVEKVIEWNEGENYIYEVTKAVNFPMKKFYAGFGVKTNEKGETVLYGTTSFRLKPGMMTGMMGGKFKKAGRDTLLGYKHYIETKEKRKDIKKLREIYKSA